MPNVTKFKLAVDHRKRQEDVKFYQSGRMHDVFSNVSTLGTDTLHKQHSDVFWCKRASVSVMSFTCQPILEVQACLCRDRQHPLSAMCS